MQIHWGYLDFLNSSDKHLEEAVTFIFIRQVAKGPIRLDGDAET